MNTITPAQLRLLHALGRKSGLGHEHLRELMQTRWPDKASLKDLSAAEATIMTRLLAQLAPRRKAPRGRARAEGVIPLISVRQRRFCQRLLSRLAGDVPAGIPMAEHFARRTLGDAFQPPAAPADERHRPLWSAMQRLSEGITTGPDAQTFIRAAIGDLKRRGLWSEPRAKEPRASARAAPRSG